MGKDNIILKAHAWLREVKASKNLNYSDISAIIGYSGAGLSKALNKDTLSFEQIKVIASDLSLESELSQYLSNKLNSENSLIDSYSDENILELVKKEKLGVVLNKMHSIFLKEDDSYKIWFEKESALAAVRMVKDILKDE